MPARLKDAKRKVVGSKRTYRALKEGQVAVCYLALDAESRIIEPLRRQCMEMGIEPVYVDSMKHLGKCCGIDVGAAAAAILK
ncbi:MAG: 50S ribosomal protein L7Ae-like protein [Firmicutes bacterium]|nr:50S ribosomal protein L7Ae-like protein [Bacillota bacterium]